MKTKVLARGLGLVALLAAPAVFAQSAATTAPPADPLALATRIQQEVAGIRGLSFKKPVSVEMQTPETLARHLDKEMAEAVPEAMDKHFGKIVRRLGLYTGPEIGDLRSMMRTVMTTQVAAYYDPDTKRIYILSGGSNELEQGLIYAHELYHGLQDQYFDLNAYESSKLKLDADQSMARHAVVEGEATYIHTLWAIKQMTNSDPPRGLVAPVIGMQANLKIEELRAMVGESAEDKAEIDSIPPFMLEVLIGNYLKGAAFIFAVQEQGWPAVEKLYKEYPPQSTEQILHPEKWLAREGRSVITWPALSKVQALKGWDLLDDDVLGEVQWRIVFNVHGLGAEAAEAAGGWDGDRYAVFKRKGSDETLLLLRTAWDSEAEATQFADAYRRVLAAKYAGLTEPVGIEQQGADVFIVEGGAKDDIAALMKVVRQAKKTRGS